MERHQLRAARLDRHWTLAQAAEQVAVDVNTLSRWERGRTRPHGYNIVRLCEVYEKTPAELGLESRPEIADAVEQFVAAPASAPLLRTSVLDSTTEREGQTQLSEHSSTSLPLIAPVLLPKHPPRRTWKRGRVVFLLAMVAFLVGSGSVWYAVAHSFASGPGKRRSHLLATAQVTPTPTTTAQRKVSTTPTGRTPASPSRTPTSPGSTPSAPSALPTRGPEPAPTPARDCLHGSVSHLAFTSLLGLGNTSPSMIAITNCGGQVESWFASIVTNNGDDWLSANPATGTIASNGSENILIQAAGTGLQIGTYQGSVTFLKGSAQWMVTVTFTIVQL